MSNKNEVKQKILDRRNNIPKKERTLAGRQIWVWGLTARELQDWRRAIRDPQRMDRNLSQAMLCQMGIRDKDGKKYFDETEIIALGDMPSADTEPIAKEVLDLSGFGLDSEEAIVKNLMKILGVAGSFEQPENTNAQSVNLSTDTQPGN